TRPAFAGERVAGWTRGLGGGGSGGAEPPGPPLALRYRALKNDLRPRVPARSISLEAAPEWRCVQRVARRAAVWPARHPVRVGRAPSVWRDPRFRLLHAGSPLPAGPRQGSPRPVDAGLRPVRQRAPVPVRGRAPR